jgi:hypothetical protein
MKKKIYFLPAIFFLTKISAQNITPLVLNNGGGVATNLEWSMNESVSISGFNAASLFLYTGFLQPTENIFKYINENTSMLNKITVGPNPTSNLLNIKLKYLEIGDLSIQLVNVKGDIILTEEAGTLYTNYEKSISIEQFPSAPYFLKIYFKPLNQIAKIVVYKIIKL